MKKTKIIGFLVCGLLLTLAAFPVFAQQAKPAGAYEINRRPFDDLAAELRRKAATENNDLTKPFAIEFKGVLSADGKLDTKKSKIVQSTGDAAMVEVGKRFIFAVGDSGFLSHLKELGSNEFDLALAQTDDRVIAILVSEMATTERAKTLSAVLNMAVRLSLEKKGEMKDANGEDERILLGGLKTSSDDKRFVIRLDYEKSVIHELINRKLKASEAKQSATSE